MQSGGGGRKLQVLYKTKMCILWRRGRCSRPSCNFAHGNSELRRPPGVGVAVGPSFDPNSTSSASASTGRREYRGVDFRDNIEGRSSPIRRYYLGGDSRGYHSLHDQWPISGERGSSLSRSPARQSYRRRHKRQFSDGESNSSGSLKISDSNSAGKKEDKISSYGEQDDLEEQLKQIQSDIGALRDDKSKLQVLLGEKFDEADRLSTRINELDSQLSKEQEECRSITSILKKFSEANGRCKKAKNELKRSQARVDDLLGSDILKSIVNEQCSSVSGADDEDPNNSRETSPSDHLQNTVSVTNKRSIPYFTISEEAKGEKRKKGRYSDMISRSGKYKSEGPGPKPDITSKGTEAMKGGNIFSASIASSDKVKGSEVRHSLPSTSMAARAVDELLEAIEMENKLEPVEASVIFENGAANNKSKSSWFPPQRPPVPQNAYKQFEGDDEEVDVEKMDGDMEDVVFNVEVEIEQ